MASPSDSSSPLGSDAVMTGEKQTKWQKSKPAVICCAKYTGVFLAGAVVALGVLFLVLWALGLVGSPDTSIPLAVDLGELPYPKVTAGFNTLAITMSPVPLALSYGPKYYLVQTQIVSAGSGRRLRSEMDGAWKLAEVVDYEVDQPVVTELDGFKLGEEVLVRYKIEMEDGRTSSPSVAVLSSTKEAQTPNPPSLAAYSTSISSVSVQIIASIEDSGSELTGFVLEHAVGTDVVETELTLEDAKKPFVVESLGASETVSFRAASVNAVGRGEFSSSPYIMTSDSEDAEKPSVPQELKIARVQADSVSLEWTAPELNNGAMLLRYVVTETTTSKTQTVDGSKTSLDFTGLDKDTEYVFQVQAENSVGFSEASDSVTAVTKLYCESDAPSSVTVLTPFSDGFSVQWGSPASPKCDMPITDYRVVDADSGEVWCKPEESGAHWCDIVKKDPAKTYSVRVQSANAGGWSSIQSEVLQVTTVAHGVCTSRDQVRWWISTETPKYEAQAFVDNLASCAAKSLGGVSGTSKCVIKYTETAHTPFALPAITDECGNCYGLNGKCGTKCATECDWGFNPSSASCIECNNRLCKPDFYACSGLYAAIAPPDPVA